MRLFALGTLIITVEEFAKSAGSVRLPAFTSFLDRLGRFSSSAVARVEGTEGLCVFGCLSRLFDFFEGWLVIAYCLV